MGEAAAHEACSGSPPVALRIRVRPLEDRGVAPRELRILGDPGRGFILAGGADLLDDDQQEFWFAELDDALVAAARLGADRHGWEEIDP